VTPASACDGAVRPRRGFTLVELLVCVVILAIFAAMAIPYLGRNHADRAMGAASLLVSDLRFAQIASMSNAQDPVVVRFKVSGTGYWLARLSSPNAPIIRPDTGAAWDVTMGVDRARTATGVGVATANIANQTLRFTPLGSVHAPTGTPTITLTASGPGGPARSAVVTIDPITGSTSVVVQ